MAYIGTDQTKLPELESVRRLRESGRLREGGPGSGPHKAAMAALKSKGYKPIWSGGGANGDTTGFAKGGRSGKDNKTINLKDSGRWSHRDNATGGDAGKHLASGPDHESLIKYLKGSKESRESMREGGPGSGPRARTNAAIKAKGFKKDKDGVFKKGKHHIIVGNDGSWTHYHHSVGRDRDGIPTETDKAVRSGKNADSF